jgi:hypothetical protein
MPARFSDLHPAVVLASEQAISRRIEDALGFERGRLFAKVNAAPEDDNTLFLNVYGDPSLSPTESATVDSWIKNNLRPIPTAWDRLLEDNFL